MRWLGPILLIGVFARHDLTWLPGYSPSEWFYILGGLWELVLCMVLLRFSTSSVMLAALWVGILESGQTALCGALMGHQRAPAGMNECDFLTGWPIGFLMTFAYLGIIGGLVAKSWYSDRRL